MRFGRSVLLGLVVAIGGCGGGAPSDRGPEEPVALPVGLFEGELLVAGERPEGLPERLSVWIEIKPQVVSGRDIETRIHTRAGGNQVWVEWRDGAWRSRYPAGILLHDEPCRSAFGAYADVAVRATGTGVEGNLAGLVVARYGDGPDPSTEHPHTSSFQAEPDRTPTRVRPVEAGLPPIGGYPVRFSEPVFLTWDGAVRVDGEEVEAQHDYAGDGRPNHSTELEHPIGTKAPLLPGQRVEVQLPGIDLAGNELPVWSSIGEVAAPIPGAPQHGFEDGALAGWYRTGDVQVAASTDSLPAIEGRYSVIAERAGGWEIQRWIDIPDTESPRLRVAARVVGPGGGGWHQDWTSVTVHAGERRIYSGANFPWYAIERLGDAPVLEIDLADLRGERALVVMGERARDWNECLPPDTVMQVDSFAVVP